MTLPQVITLLSHSYSQSPDPVSFSGLVPLHAHQCIYLLPPSIYKMLESKSTSCLHPQSLSWFLTHVRYSTNSCGINCGGKKELGESSHHSLLAQKYKSAFQLKSLLPCKSRDSSLWTNIKKQNYFNGGEDAWSYLIIYKIHLFFEMNQNSEFFSSAELPTVLS